MSEELLKLLERQREVAAAARMVDAFLGPCADARVRANLARATADGYRAEGRSIADAVATANLRVALMDNYGSGWPESAEWKAHKAKADSHR
jgi:hypothetical protein